MSDTDNIFWGPVENLRTLLASSVTYQGLLEIPDEEQGEDRVDIARPSIYCPALPPPGAGETIADQRPFCIIAQGDEFVMSRQSTTVLPEKGSLLWMLEANVPEEYLTTEGKEDPTKKEAAEKWFMKLAGDILSDIQLLSNTGGYLAVSGVALRAGPVRADETIKPAEGDFYQVTFEVRWGAWT